MNNQKYEHSNEHTTWISKYGWIVSTIIASIALLASIIEPILR